MSYRVVWRSDKIHGIKHRQDMIYFTTGIKHVCMLLVLNRMYFSKLISKRVYAFRLKKEAKFFMQRKFCMKRV